MPSKRIQKTDKKIKGKYFNIIRRMRKADDGEMEQIAFDIQFKDDNSLSYHLRNLTELDSFYADEPIVNAETLLVYLNIFREDQKVEGISDLITLLESEFAQEVSMIDNMIKEGVVSFDALGFLFKKGEKVYTWDENEIIAGEVVSFKHVNSFFGSTFKIKIKYIESDGATFKLASENYSIGSYNKARPINELEIRPLTEEIEKDLIERGKLYQEIALNSAYRYHTGNLIYKEWWKTNKYKATGRVMIDNYNFARVNPEYDRDYGCEPEDSARNNFTEIPEHQLYMTDPWVRGFSFVAKKWGEFAVSSINRVKFDENSFEQLVMDAERKELVKALVEHSNDSFSDIISGKGGGCIFLLHGPPGCGKTLTAESIAELLERPLYSVSVGELGINPDVLEERLRQILDMATAWNAVVLIDEADIFLEARDENDIERNAMVGIFLRLLEYHQGVMFLTTNRVNTFDEAFFSRISVSLEYEALGTSSRQKIWFMLLKAANIEMNDVEINQLAVHELNGRQIKNVIRLGQSLAKSKNVAVSLEHFENTIRITGQFQKAKPNYADEDNSMK